MAFLTAFSPRAAVLRDAFACVLAVDCMRAIDLLICIDVLGESARMRMRECATMWHRDSLRKMPSVSAMTRGFAVRMYQLLQ